MVCHILVSSIFFLYGYIKMVQPTVEGIVDSMKYNTRYLYTYGHKYDIAYYT